MKLRERIENDLVIWMLGTVVTGFLAGIGAYQGILEISGSQVVSRAAHVLADDKSAIKTEELQELRDSKVEAETKVRSKDLEIAKITGNKDAEIADLNGILGESQRQLVRAKETEKTLNQQVAILAEMDRFLSLYLRYELTKRELAGEKAWNVRVFGIIAQKEEERTEEDKQLLLEWTGTRNALSNYIEERFGDGALTLRKGEKRKATVSFGEMVLSDLEVNLPDKTPWTLPYELKVVERR